MVQSTIRALPNAAMPRAFWKDHTRYYPVLPVCPSDYSYVYILGRALNRWSVVALDEMQDTPETVGVDCVVVLSHTRSDIQRLLWLKVIPEYQRNG